MNWIAGAVKHKGALRSALHVKKGKNIPKSKLRAAEKRKGKIGAEARLAVTLSSLHHKRHKAGVNRDGHEMVGHSD